MSCASIDGRDTSQLIDGDRDELLETVSRTDLPPPVPPPAQHRSLGVDHAGVVATGGELESVPKICDRARTIVKRYISEPELAVSVVAPAGDLAFRAPGAAVTRAGYDLDHVGEGRNHMGSVDCPSGTVAELTAGVLPPAVDGSLLRGCAGVMRSSCEIDGSVQLDDDFRDVYVVCFSDAELTLATSPPTAY